MSQATKNKIDFLKEIKNIIDDPLPLPVNFETTKNSTDRKIKELQDSCEHEFVNGFCKWCYLEEPEPEEEEE